MHSFTLLELVIFYAFCLCMINAVIDYRTNGIKSSTEYLECTCYSL